MKERWSARIIFNNRQHTRRYPNSITLFRTCYYGMVYTYEWIDISLHQGKVYVFTKSFDRKYQISFNFSTLKFFTVHKIQLLFYHFEFEYCVFHWFLFLDHTYAYSLRSFKAFLGNVEKRRGTWLERTTCSLQQMYVPYFLFFYSS